MAKCVNCENALIGRSRVIHPISDSQRMVSDWTIRSIKCSRNRKTSIFSEVNCSDFVQENNNGKQ